VSAAVRVDGLTRRYRSGEPPALDALHLTVPAGGSVALLGPSGAGKTTALRLIAGLETPDAGDVVIDGRSVTGVAPERRGIAMVFQRPLLLPHLSVLDNVAFSARARGCSRADARHDARQYLDLVELEPFAARRVDALSGGQEQRVALARALAARPRVLLLDEPFAALDPALREQMRDLVRHLRAVVAPTLLLVTHDREEAAGLADEIAVLDRGRLHQLGPVEHLVRRPSSVAVAHAMGARNLVPGIVRAGRHESPLGSHALPPGSRVGDGPAVLVIRHELVRLVAPSAAEAVGVVTDVRSIGVRRLVSLVAHDPRRSEQRVTVRVELPPGETVNVGCQAGLLLPPESLAVVPVDTDGGVAARPPG